MTTTEQLILLGTIWVAPHAHKGYAFFVGGIFFLVVVCKGLGWI
jgi:hypothetical protein